MPSMIADPQTAGGILGERAFEGRAVLVTGGGSGIGRATAVALAGLGARVVVAGRRTDALKRTAELATGIVVAPGDVSRPPDAAQIVRQALSATGRLDVLVNNAGAVTPAPLGETDYDAVYRLWATNMFGPTLLTERTSSRRAARS
jgi:meso-butanediol dehydrogenase / (S,S)-butanediol dehydrogenase / diacetyl reductase